MYDTPTGHAVRASLQAIAADKAAPSAFVRDALKERICAAVDELKAKGWPVERIIVRINEVAAEVGMPKDLGAGGRETVVSEVIRWCIHHYFRDAYDTDGQ
jgi:hypothetical protein